MMVEESLTSNASTSSGLRTRATSITFFLVWSVGFLILDQVVKAIVRQQFVVGQKFAFPFPGVLELTLTYNEGIAFGLFQGAGIIFAPVALLITGWTFLFCRKHPHELRLTHFACALLAAGAIGNLIDRVFLGKVTDMFWFRLINFPVFNVADSCITIGAVLFILRFLLEPKVQGLHQE